MISSNYNTLWLLRERNIKFILIIAISSQKTITAPYIKVCPRKIPNMANCIMNSIDSMRHILASGDFGPGYEAIPRLEPFYLPR